MRRRTRRILVIFIVLGLLGAGGVGAWYALKEGRRSLNPFERGLAAEQKGNFEVAERRYRTLLATKPDHPRAFRRLVWVLQKQGKFTAIDEVAKERCASAPDLVDGWSTRVDMAMRRGQFAEAERIARTRAAMSPLLLQSTLWRIQDISNDPRRRLAAAETALRYAQLAESAESRAVAELFAARTYFELAQLSSSESAAKELRDRAVRIQEDGSAQLTRSMQTRPNKLASILLARFALLDQGAAARHRAESELSLWLRSNQETAQGYEVRRDLIAYRLRDGTTLPLREKAVSPDESREAYFAIALELAEPFANDPAHRLFRLLRSFSLAGADAEALQLLSARTSTERDDLIEIERCRILFRTKQEPPEEIANRALEVLKRTEDWRTALLAHDIARGAGQPDAALDALEAHRRSHPALELDLSLAQRMAGDESRVGEAVRLVEGSFSDDSDQRLLRPILAALERAGPEHVMAFLERRIADPGKEELTYRIIRVIQILRQMGGDNGSGTNGQDLATLARSDLERCLELDEQATPQSWLTCARLALTLKEYGLAGRCAGRLIGQLKVGVSQSLSIFAAAAAAEDATAREAFLRELEAATAGTPDAEWVAPICNSIRAGKLAFGDVLDAILAAHPVETAHVRTLELAAPLAMIAGRRDVAEQVSRQLRKSDPNHPVAAAILGEILLGKKDFQAVLDLHDGTDTEPKNLVPLAHEQCIRALVGLDRAKDAVARAQQYFQSHLEEQRAYISLAMALMADDQNAAALGVLTSARQTDRVQIQRARLLLALKRTDVAEQLLWTLCRRLPQAVPAWQMLAAQLGTANRAEELVLPLGEALNSAAVKSDPRVAAMLLMLRGLARESSEQRAEAIEDYTKSVEMGNRDLRALNNAAWLIYVSDRAKLATAKKYVEMAFESYSRNPNLNDTAAHVYWALEEYDRAIACIAVAVELKPKNWPYRLTQIRVLAAAGKRKEALTAIDRLEAEEPPLGTIQEAKDLRKGIQAD